LSDSGDLEGAILKQGQIVVSEADLQEIELRRWIQELQILGIVLTAREV